MIQISNTHKPAGVFTFVPSDSTQHLIDKLLNIKFDSTDRLYNNYTNMPWNKFSAISLYLRNLEVVGFSSIWNRTEFYSPGEVRILNRYWESPSMRKISTQIGNNHIIEMVTQQLNMATQLGFTTAFISRERTPRYFNKLISNIAQKTNTEWITNPDKVCVCNSANPNCWQYKAFTKL
jgi:hypothetical protein